MVVGVEVEAVLTNRTMCYGMGLAFVGRVLLVTCAADTSARLRILIVMLDAGTELRLCWYC